MARPPKAGGPSSSQALSFDQSCGDQAQSSLLGGRGSPKANRGVSPLTLGVTRGAPSLRGPTSADGVPSPHTRCLPPKQRGSHPSALGAMKEPPQNRKGVPHLLTVESEQVGTPAPMRGTSQSRGGPIPNTVCHERDPPMQTGSHPLTPGTMRGTPKSRWGPIPSHRMP